MPAVANATAEKWRADAYPTIRFFSVGHRTASPTPLRNLQTVWEPWQVASNVSINKDFGPGHTLFSSARATSTRLDHLHLPCPLCLPRVAVWISLQRSVLAFWAGDLDGALAQRRGADRPHQQQLGRH